MTRHLSLAVAALLCVLLGCNASAHTKKKSRTNLKLIEAYTQKILPGVPGAPIKTNTYILIVWEGAKYPETFFWRGESGWQTCNMRKAHKNTNKVPGSRKSQDYFSVQVTNDQVSKGDTLELIPVAGGKFPVPAEIPASAKNTLYYKTGGSSWLSFPIKNMGHKPDIAMP